MPRRPEAFFPELTTEVVSRLLVAEMTEWTFNPHTPVSVCDVHSGEWMIDLNLVAAFLRGFVLLQGRGILQG